MTFTAEFLEALTSEIKRFDPTQSRDNSGKWSAGGSVGEGARAIYNLREGTAAELLEKHGLAIPANATNVEVSDDPDADVLGRYKDGAGRKQVRPLYHPDYKARQDAAKFSRVAALHQKLPSLNSHIERDIASGGRDAHAAMTLRLILKTGLRNGGDGGKGKEAAYGASSLLTSQATVSGDRVQLDFIGKEGVRQHHTFTDSVLADHIMARQAAGNETIFDGNDKRTLAYAKKATGNKSAKVHDLRTMYGSALAASLVEKIPAPKTAAEAEFHKQRIGYAVSQHLGHAALTPQEAAVKVASKTPNASPEQLASKAATELRNSRTSATSMSLTNYIHPDVFAGWPTEAKSIMPDETLIAFGSEIKSAEETPDSYKFGAYLVVFDSTDLSPHRDHFTKSTDYGFEDGETRPILYNHGLDGTIGKSTIGKARLYMKDAGVWMEGEIKRRKDYLEKHIERIGQGLTQTINVRGIDVPIFGTSSGATSHSVIRKRSGDGHEVKQWHIGEATVCPTPAAPETMCGAIKSLDEWEAQSVPDDDDDETDDAPIEAKAIGSANHQAETARYVEMALNRTGIFAIQPGLNATGHRENAGA